MQLNAQVVNTGGGGPDGHYNKKRIAGSDENSKFKQQRIEKIRNSLNEWIKIAKEDWSSCYTKKLKADNIIEVYTQLSVMSEMKPPKLKKKAMDRMIQLGGEECEEDIKFKCFFKNENNNNKLFNIINEPSMHDYLETMEIEKEQSRNEFIKFFKNKLRVNSLE
jgi:hypothetical protein